MLFQNCASEPQATEQIFAHFNLSYEQPNQQIRVGAHFSKGLEEATASPIKIIEGVNFQGRKMQEKEVSKNETRYISTQKEDFKMDYSFSFLSPEKKEIQHTINIKPLDDINIKGDFSKSKDVQISWKESPLLENETIVFLFKNEKNDFVNFEINGPTNASSVNLPSEKLKKLPLGIGNLFLVRKQRNTTQNSNVSIISETEFYSQVISVTILP